MANVTLSCPKSDCGKRLRFDLDPEDGPRTVRCPVCKTTFSVALAPPAEDLAPLEPATRNRPDLDDLEPSEGIYGMAEEDSLVFLLRLEEDGRRLSAEETATKKRLIAEGLTANPRRCPACEGKLARDSVLCVACGLNLKTGKRKKLTVEKPAKKPERERSGLETAGAVAEIIITILGSG